jgi:polyvinyl alcohol dehydrogenase (cytochrome)
MARTLIQAVIVIAPLLVAVSGCGRAPEHTATAAEPQKAGSSTLESTDALVSKAQTVDPETLPGAPLYKQQCAQCHDSGVAKAPNKLFLQMLSPDTIHRALTAGVMVSQAAALSGEQRRQVADYLGSSMVTAEARREPPVCDKARASFDSSKAPLAAGWGYDNARRIAAADAGLTPATAADLELKWAFEFPNAIRARSQPTIAYGAVYVGSADGTVYALDLQSGCVRWSFNAGAEVRTAIVVAGGTQPRAYFGDLVARAYAVDALTGKLAWSSKLDDHPHATLTGTPAFHDGRVYFPISSLEVTSAADPAYECCTFRGAIAAVDGKTGAQLWKAYSIANPPRETGRTRLGTRVLGPSGAPIWNSPTIDAKRGVLYAGTGENYSTPADESSDALLAIRLSDGVVLWKRQLTRNDAWNVACMMKDNPNCPRENGPDVDFASGAILARTRSGQDLLLAGQKNGAVYALDPDRQGEVVWQVKVGRGGVQGGVHFGMALDGERLFVPISDMADGHDGRVYDSPPRPGLYALDIATGKTLWSTPADNVCAGRAFCDPGISAATTVAGAVVIAGHMDGRVRAYDASNGTVVWQQDSAREFETVSGAKASGGSIGGAGAAVRDGYVVINSGYGVYFHMPGNVLLTFGPKS